MLVSYTRTISKWRENEPVTEIWSCKLSSLVTLCPNKGYDNANHSRDVLWSILWNVGGPREVITPSLVRSCSSSIFISLANSYPDFASKSSICFIYLNGHRSAIRIAIIPVDTICEYVRTRNRMVDMWCYEVWAGVDKWELSQHNVSKNATHELECDRGPLWKISTEWSVLADEVGTRFRF